MNVKILLVMSLLALSTFAIAASRDEKDDIETLVLKTVEDSNAKRLAALQVHAE